jgi:glycosyltransferase involved in cell wall biosynthesis
MSQRPPLVSVSVPTYNAEPWIRSTIESVLAQTYERFELVISDGGSTDDTEKIVRSFDDPRIRIDFAPQRLPAIANWNRSVLLADGDYIKFLHQDDTIVPPCLEDMLQVALEDPSIGLVFSRRRIVLEQGPKVGDLAWSQTYADLHRGFTNLERINEGRDLFRQLLDASFETNWVGEPSSVLMSRTCLTRTGLFNPRLRQVMDLELWCRAMLHYRIGFVDQALSTYLHHEGSMTEDNARSGKDWLDRLWLFEGLLSCRLDPAEEARLKRLRRSAARAAVTTQARRIVKRRFSGEFVGYAQYRLGAVLGRAPELYPRLPDAGPDGTPGRTSRKAVLDRAARGA